MKKISLICTLALTLSGGAALAQSGGGASVRVEPGHFCAQNKCVRFSSDLRSVSVQGRRAVSVASYDLQNNPVVSGADFRAIYLLALRQTGVNGNR